MRGLRMGAIGALTKPLRTKEALERRFARSRQVHRAAHRRKLLIVEPDDAPPAAHRRADQRRRTSDHSRSSQRPREALAALQGQPFRRWWSLASDSRLKRASN